MSLTEAAFANTDLTAELMNEKESSHGAEPTSSTPAGCDVAAAGAESAKSALDIQEQLRAAKRTLIFQSQQIDDLESYLQCIVSLHAKVRELELNEKL